MARSFALFLRLSVIACAAAMLLLCVHAARAQDFQPAPTTSGVSVPLGQGGEPDPYAYYKPPPPQTQGYYTALAQPTGPSPAPVPAYQPAQPFLPAQPATMAPAPMPPAPMQAVQPAAYQPGPSYAAPGYLLGPGDKLHITVFGEDDLSGQFEIDGMGMVRLPLIGTMRAAGYTAPGLEAWIRNALGNGYLKHPRVNVEITTYRPFYVVGAVPKPGEYPYAENLTVLNAVALAGGFSDQAVKSEVYIRHQGGTEEETVPANLPVYVRPGDVVRVKTTVFWDALNMLSPLASPAAIAAAAAHP